jgi:hypothetical protein
MIDATTIALIGGGSAIAGGLLTGAYQHARDYFARPQLLIDYKGTDANKVTSEQDNDGKHISEIYIRVRVQNKGRAVAKGCRVFLADLHEVHPSGKATPTVFYDSKQCRWAGWDDAPRDIPNGVRFYSDVMRVSKYDLGWKFSFNLFANESPLREYKGTYRFRLVATSDNAEPSVCTIDVTYDGDWHNLRAVAV